MQDLLTATEIKALTLRLRALKKYLKKLEDDKALIAPTGWGMGTAEQLEKEQQSYYADWLKKFPAKSHFRPLPKRPTSKPRRK